MATAVEPFCAQASPVEAGAIRRLQLLASRIVPELPPLVVLVDHGEGRLPWPLRLDGAQGKFHPLADLILHHAGLREPSAGRTCTITLPPFIRSRAWTWYSTAWHEIAHWCTASPALTDPPIDQLPCVWREIVAGSLMMPSKSSSPAGPPKHGWCNFDSPLLRRDRGHGADFQRAVAHLAYRSARCGLDVGCGVVGGHLYGLSYGACYLQALGNELVQRRNDPLRDILRWPAPRAFVELYQRDTEPPDVDAFDEIVEAA